MSTIKANAYLDSSGGNTATINGITPISLTTLNASGSAPVYACRAWVNFSGVTTVTIRGSGNVSSIVRNSTGNYTVNFATAMQDVNYAAVASSSQAAFGSNTQYAANVSDLAVGSCRLSTATAGSSSSVVVDNALISLAIFR